MRLVINISELTSHCSISGCHFPVSNQSSNDFTYNVPKVFIPDV